MSDKVLLPEKLEQLQKKSLVAGLVALGMFLSYSLLLDRGHFFQSYLIGYMFALGACLGSIVLLCIIHLTGGGWGYILRRILEAASQTVLPMFILFLPILIFGMDSLYPWLHLTPENDPFHIAATKTAYLNRSFFIARALLYFAVWYIMGKLLYTWSVKQDETGDLVYRQRMKKLAGPAILIYMLTVSFAAFDWCMSLEPMWFSSIYGAMFAIGQGITIFAFSIIFVCWLANFQPLKDELTTQRLHNIGNLQFAFVILWAYIEVSQFIIIWSANLPEEITWYMNRSTPGMKTVSFLLVLFQFVVPFLILLSRHTKRNPKIIVWIAGGLLFMRVIDLWWIIAPSIHLPATNPSGNAMFSLTDLIAPFGFAALWFSLFLRQFRKLPVLPTRDPVWTKGYDYKKEAA